MITGRERRPRPYASVLLLLLVTGLSIAQILQPAVRDALQVDHDEIFHHAQVWRLVTGALVQSGGLVGLVLGGILLIHGNGHGYAVALGALLGATCVGVRQARVSRHRRVVAGS